MPKHAAVSESKLPADDTVVAITRRVIATSYAVGHLCQVPWDVYMQSVVQDRYFGQPAQYADLFGFIRANAWLLEGYVEAAAAGRGVGYESESPVTTNDDRVYAFTRVRPQDRKAPIVIHLVSWQDDNTPFEVRLTPAEFFGRSPVQIKLRTPAPYDEAVHQQAQQHRDFAPFSCERLLNIHEAHGQACVTLGDVSPWAILVVSPASPTKRRENILGDGVEREAVPSRDH